MYKFYKKLTEDRSFALDYDAAMELQMRKLLIEIVGCFLVKMYTGMKQKLGVNPTKREKYPIREMRKTAYAYLLKLFPGMYLVDMDDKWHKSGNRCHLP